MVAGAAGRRKRVVKTSEDEEDEEEEVDGDGGSWTEDQDATEGDCAAKEGGIGNMDGER